MADQAAINTAIDLDLFQAIENGGGKGVHVSELSKETGADPKLLGTISRNALALPVMHESYVSDEVISLIAEASGRNWHCVRSRH